MTTEQAAYNERIAGIVTAWRETPSVRKSLKLICEDLPKEKHDMLSMVLESLANECYGSGGADVLNNLWKSRISAKRS